jgi:hypothetical protein
VAVAESLAGESFDEFGEGWVGDNVEVMSALPDGSEDFGEGDVGLEVGVQAPGHAGQVLGHRALTAWVCRWVAGGVWVHGWWLDPDEWLDPAALRCSIVGVGRGCHLRGGDGLAGGESGGAQGGWSPVMVSMITVAAKPSVLTRAGT